MLDLEYLILFGLPGNKLELIDGYTRCRLPLATREEAEAHFEHWAKTLAQWQGIELPRSHGSEGNARVVEINDFRLSLDYRRITLETPMGDCDTFLNPQRPFSWRDFWPGPPLIGDQDESVETLKGFEPMLDHQDVSMNLWRWFDDHDARSRGHFCGRCDVVLSDRDVVQPDFFFYRADRLSECLVGDAFYQGPPDLVVEVVTPFSRHLDHGLRRERYAHAGVPHFWIADPAFQTLDVYEFGREGYHFIERLESGDVYRVPLLDSAEFAMSDLFHFQLDREDKRHDEPAPCGWIVPIDRKLELQHLLLLGHGDRRFEILDNTTPCVLAFGCEEEARARFLDFATEIARWAGEPVDQDDRWQVRAGAFDMRLDGLRVHLDVQTDARTYRQLLDVYHRSDVWREGEEDLPSSRFRDPDSLT